MAAATMGKMLGSMPGGEQVESLLLRRVRRELSSLDRPTLERYLGLLENLAHGIRTGEGFNELMSQ